MSTTQRRAALERAARALLDLAGAVEALAQADDDGERDPLLDLEALWAEFKVGRDAVLGACARGELVASRGPRKRVLVRRSAVEQWLAAHPVKGRVRVRKASPGLAANDLVKVEGAGSELDGTDGFQAASDAEAAWQRDADRDLERQGSAGRRRR